MKISKAILDIAKSCVRKEKFIVHEHVVDIARYKLKLARKQAHKYGLKPEDLRLYHTNDGKKHVVAYLDNKVYYITNRGLK